MIVLSHRGYWLAPEEKNTPAAFERSFQQGFGTETDIRDATGRLVISHDPPRGREMTFDDFLALHHRHNANLPMAINVKADGLQGLVAAALERNRPADWFVFDMSIPDTRGWLQAGFPVFVRHSDLERDPCFYDAAAGIWLDAFEKDWITAKDILAHLDAGKRVCVVSPELHRRVPDAFWAHLAASDCRRSQNLMLCTDRPVEARALLGET